MRLYNFITRAKIANSCIQGITAKRSFKNINWTIGTGVNKRENCCRTRFMMVYDIRKSTLETICKSIKAKEYSLGSGSSLTGSLSHLNKEERNDAIEQIVNLCTRNNITLTQDQVSFNYYNILLF